MGYHAANEVLGSTSLVTAGPGNAIQYAGTAPGASTTNPPVIDLQANRDVAEGENCYFVLRATTSFTSNGVARLIAGVVTADDAGLSVNVRVPVVLGGGTPLLVGATDLIGSLAGFVASELVAPTNNNPGTELLLPISPMVTRQRYMGVVFINPVWLTTFWTAGVIAVHLSRDPKQHIIYPAAV